MVGLSSQCSVLVRTDFDSQHAAKLFELVKARDLEGLVVKRKDGKYRPETKWFKVLNPAYSQKDGRQEFFQKLIQ
jgi:ATP-dependent DNA ligase